MTRRIVMTHGAWDGRVETVDHQEIILCPPDDLVDHPLDEAHDVAGLYAIWRAAGANVRLARCERDAFEHLCRSWRTGDATDVQTAHVSFSGLENPQPALLPTLPAPRLIWIGQGSNTWRSELNLDIRYVRTKGPANVPGATLGIPWMAGIPGTVGGWIKMNAGAFGHSISEALEAVCVDGIWYAPEQCGFGYRHSDISGEIQDFRLKPRDAITTEGDANYYLQRRRKFPAGTFGSFFKNPAGDHAGRLLEAAGAKELRVGGAYVWAEHANVIVAGAGATPSDVLALSRLMRARVHAHYGLWLEPEVRGI